MVELSTALSIKERVEALNALAKELLEAVEQMIKEGSCPCLETDELCERCEMGY